MEEILFNLNTLVDVWISSEPVDELREKPNPNRECYLIVGPFVLL